MKYSQLFISFATVIIKIKIKEIFVRFICNLAKTRTNPALSELCTSLEGRGKKSKWAPFKYKTLNPLSIINHYFAKSSTPTLYIPYNQSYFL